MAAVLRPWAEGVARLVRAQRRIKMKNQQQTAKIKEPYTTKKRAACAVRDALSLRPGLAS